MEKKDKVQELMKSMAPKIANMVRMGDMVSDKVGEHGAEAGLSLFVMELLQIAKQERAEQN